MKLDGAFGRPGRVQQNVASVSHITHVLREMEDNLPVWCGHLVGSAGKEEVILNGARVEGPQMTSPYLNRPLLPLAVVLPRMLQEIEAALPIAGPAETCRLHKRAELIRSLLPSQQSFPPA